MKAFVISTITVALVALAACSSSDVATPQRQGPTDGLPARALPDAEQVRMVAVGDVACQPSEETTSVTCQQQATADLTSRLAPDVVLPLGDLQYERGELDAFEESWQASWGQFASILAPVAGNHEYGTEGAAGYYDYFDVGSYYVRQIGSWRVYLLDSNCDQVSCTEQADWLAQDLREHPTDCTAIAMHHPRWSSGGEHGSQDAVQPLWKVAADGGVDVSLAAHDHSYERFAPMDAEGQPTEDGQGTRHFVVGTGGRSLYELGDRPSTSQFAQDESFGVLDLTLSEDSYSWQFIDIDDEVLDSGSGACSRPD